MNKTDAKRLVRLLTELEGNAEALLKLSQEHCAWHDAGKFGRIKSTSRELKRDMQLAIDSADMRIIE